MIFLLPLAILICAVSAFFANREERKSRGDENQLIVLSGYSVAIILVLFIVYVPLIWLFIYYEYNSNKAIVAIYEEAVNIKTLELEETVAIQKTNEIFQNKFSDKVTVSVNLDDPIRATQEYLQDIQEQRMAERNAYIEAKRDIIAYENGIFGWGIY